MKHWGSLHFRRFERGEFVDFAPDEEHEDYLASVAEVERVSRGRGGRTFLVDRLARRKDKAK